MGWHGLDVDERNVKKGTSQKHLAHVTELKYMFQTVLVFCKFFSAITKAQIMHFRVSCLDYLDLAYRQG